MIKVFDVVLSALNKKIFLDGKFGRDWSIG